MRLLNTSKDYFNGFEKVAHFSKNDASTNVTALLKIISYFTLIIPLGFAATYGFASLKGRTKKKQSLPPHEKTISDQGKQMLLGTPVRISEGGNKEEEQSLTSQDKVASHPEGILTPLETESPKTASEIGTPVRISEGGNKEEEQSLTSQNKVASHPEGILTPLETESPKTASEISNKQKVNETENTVNHSLNALNEDPMIEGLSNQIRDLNKLIDSIGQNYPKLSLDISNCKDEISKITNHLLATNETIKEKKQLRNLVYEEYLNSGSRWDNQDPALLSKFEELQKDFNKILLAAAPELDRLNLQLATLEKQDSDLSTQLFIATNSVNLLNRQILDIQDEKRLAAVQKNALNGISPPDKHPIDVINAIQKELENKDIRFLEQLVRPYENQIELLHQKEREIRGIVDAGQASRNRALISDPDSSLNDYNVMLAVFAKEALETKNNPKFKKVNQITMARIVRSVFESPMYFIELEALPPNAGEKNYQKYDEYLQRKERNYLNKIDSLQKVADTLRVEVVNTTPVDKPYNSNNWKEYAREFDQLLQSTDKLVKQGKTMEILANRGRWSPESIINQTRSGLSDLFIASDLGCTVDSTTDRFTYEKTVHGIKVDGTIDDVVNALNTSPHLLDPGISHFLDRLHLMGALVDKEACITTSDGKSYSGADVLKKLVSIFTEGVTTENAIAAEQMHARIMLCLHALPK